jgi:hypothetical protein
MMGRNMHLNGVLQRLIESTPQSGPFAPPKTTLSRAPFSQTDTVLALPVGWPWLLIFIYCNTVT